MIRPLEAMPDRDLARGQVDQGRRNKEGADPAGALLVHLDGGFSDGRQSADARADDDAGPLEILGRLGFPPGVQDGLVRRRDRVEDEVIDAALVLGRHGGVGVKGSLDVRSAAAPAIDAGHLKRDLTGIALRIKCGDPSRAGFPGQDGLPGDLPTLAQWGQEADSRNDDSTH